MRDSEEKVIRTYAPDVNEIQTIATFANPGETLSGTFTVVVDLTASGGSIETSAQIPFDAAAMQGAQETRCGPFRQVNRSFLLLTMTQTL